MKNRLDMSTIQGRFNLADKLIDKPVYELTEDEIKIIEGST